MDNSKLSHISDLRDEALIALEAELVEAFQTLRTQELSVDSVTELTNLSHSIQRVRAELSNRNVAEPESSISAEELASQAQAAIEAVELTNDDEDEAEEAEAPAETEAVEAAAVKTVELAIEPDGLEGNDLGHGRAPAVIVAGADIPRIPAGTEFNDMRSVAEAFMDRRQSLRGVSGGGDGDDVIVASIRADYPEERRLGSDIATNRARLDSVTSPEAIVASGGLCAPLEPYYGIQVISQASRPVRDSLPKFAADRGGVRWIAPPKLTDLSGAIGNTTATQDAGTYGSTTPYKPCLHVTCGAESTVTVQAVHRCLTFGNFAARTYPEQVEAWLSLAIAAHARRAETLLLDAIDAASTQVTAAATYSAVRTLLPQIDQAVAAYRSRHRTAADMTLRVMLPAWVKELIRADVNRSYMGNSLEPLSVSDAQIMAWFADRGVNVTFYIDSATATGQLFGAQGAGALDAFPSTVVWYLFVEGSFVFLDGGVLDLGLVRDSTLNKTNDYQIFAETFEAVAFYGIESLKITSTVCPNGAYAPEATAQAPCPA